jgi:hypothetical protein
MAPAAETEGVQIVLTGCPNGEVTNLPEVNNRGPSISLRAIFARNRNELVAGPPKSRTVVTPLSR